MSDSLAIRNIRRHLRRQGIDTLEDANADSVRFQLRGSDVVGVVNFLLVKRSDRLVAMATLPMQPALSDRTSVLQLIALVNWNLLDGHFDLDLSDGEIRFSITFPVRGFLIRPARATDHAIGILAAMAEGFAPAFFSVLTGLKTPLEAYLATIPGKHWNQEAPDAVAAMGKAFESMESGVAGPPARREGEGTSSDASRKRHGGAKGGPAGELVNGYALEPLNVRGIIPVAKVETAIRNYLAVLDGNSPVTDALPDRPHMTILLSGPPGTGKSEFVRYLGETFGLPVVVRTAGDLLDKWVGNTEKFIREAFAEASKRRSILFLDEFDGILQSRDEATAGWQISHTNEILRAMEDFQGIVVAATNLAERLDPAVLRRFTYKFEFDYLTSEGKQFFFKRAFATELTDEEKARLNSIPDLAPGDFRTISQGLYFLGEEATNSVRLDALARESEFKNRKQEAWKRPSGPRIGFVPDFHLPPSPPPTPTQKGTEP